PPAGASGASEIVTLVPGGSVRSVPAEDRLPSAWLAGSDKNMPLTPVSGRTVPHAAARSLIAMQAGAPDQSLRSSSQRSRTVTYALLGSAAPSPTWTPSRVSA